MIDRISRASAIPAGLAACLAFAIAVAGARPAGAQSGTLPGNFVYLADVDPSIFQDIRYAGPNNFIGRRLSGYDAAECVVKRPVALALKAAQAALKRGSLSLKMYDCYRPVRAVREMFMWSKDPRETPAQRNYNPRMSKQDLFRLGYMAEHSGHSTGAAIDVTIVSLPRVNVAPFDSAASYGSCIAPAGKRAPDDSLDMGTGYDCADVLSHTASRDITVAQRRARQRLVVALSAVGFVNYSKEWWHFSYPGVAAGAYDFPIDARR